MLRNLIFPLFFILFSSLATYADCIFGFRDSTPVKVKDWSQRSIFFSEVFFERVEHDLVNKIGKDEFLKFKLFSSTNSWPEAMQYKMDWAKDTAANVAFYNKLNKLKLLKIAEFELKRNDGVLQYFCILKVPYSINRQWDQSAVWDDVYFLFQKQFVNEN